MGLKRCVGTTPQFPQYLIELFFDQNKKIIGTILYDKNTLNIVSKETLSKIDLKKLVSITKKDLDLLNKDDFSRYVKLRKEYRNDFKEFLSKKNNEDCTICYTDSLYTDALYATAYYGKNLLARIILEFNDNNSTYARFNKEELRYPSLLFFLKNSIKKEKVALFIMEDKIGEDYSVITYKMDKDSEFFIGLVNEESGDILDLKVYDENFIELVSHQDTCRIKELMKDFIYKQRFIIKANKYLQEIHE